MARPKKTDRPRKITVSVPASVMAKVELKLLDPLRGRARYGALSGLMTDLLRGWIEEPNLTLPSEEELQNDGNAYSINAADAGVSVDTSRPLHISPKLPRTGNSYLIRTHRLHQ